jgi:hypothetical protein
MSNRIITIEIDNTTGDLTVELDGYQGVGCSAVQEAFARTLGKTTHSVSKPVSNTVSKPSKTV